MAVALIELVQISALLLPLQAILFQGLVRFLTRGNQALYQGDRELLGAVALSMATTAAAATIALYTMLAGIVLPFTYTIPVVAYTINASGELVGTTGRLLAIGSLILAFYILFFIGNGLRNRLYE